MSNSTQDRINDTRKLSDGALAAAENLGKEFKTSVQHVGSAIKDASQAVSHDVGVVAKDAYDSILSSGQEKAKQMESTVKESPLLAIGIAFGVGVLVSTLLARRS
jgi:ElaB/YqjD/DUF883 family membrane-anchored ribosome-binding protein